MIGFLSSNIVYYSQTKKAVNDEMVLVATDIASNLEQNHLDGENIDKYLESISSLGYQLRLISFDQADMSYGKSFSEDELPKEVTRRVLQENSIYNGILDYRSPLLIMGHFSNDIENTVGVPVEINGNSYALFVRQANHLLFSGIHMILIGFILTFTVISLISVFLMARYLVHPIVTLKNATQAILNENFSFQLNINRKDEIGELAQSFHEMQNQLLHNDKARKAFITNMSHDFQSPLLNIQGYSGLLLNNDLTETEQKEYLEIVIDESNRLSSLTKQLLLLTSLDQSDYPSNFIEVRIDEQLKSVVRHNRWRLEEKEIELIYQLTPTVVKVDQELMMNVWDNLLTNAIKYNRKLGKVWIEMKVEKQYLAVLFKDTGIGIKEESLHFLFNRFYREQRVQAVGGTGLGLSIVQEIVSLHNGKITVDSNENEGTTMTIYLPINKNFSNN